MVWVFVFVTLARSPTHYKRDFQTNHKLQIHVQYNDSPREGI